MTHGFDDSGAKFDQKGNMRGWWSAGDKKRFEKKGKGLVRQFNAYTVAKGVRINGQLTLGENIADLGGLAIAFDAYQKHLKKTGRKAVGGLSPEMRFFLAFAQQEREVARDEFKKFMAAIDPHSPGFLRGKRSALQLQALLRNVRRQKRRQALPLPRLPRGDLVAIANRSAFCLAFADSRWLY